LNSERVLPRAFVQLGMLTHVAFDTLAAQVGSGPADAISGSVGITTIQLSGFMFPISGMPEGLQWLTLLNPVRD
jgi:hypothetical protein